MTEPVVASIAIQMGPLLRPDGEPFGGSLALFAESLTAYIATNLEKFADPRGGDLFVAVSITRGEDRAGHEYRSGHYVKEVKDEQERAEVDAADQEAD